MSRWARACSLDLLSGKKIGSGVFIFLSNYFSGIASPPQTRMATRSARGSLCRKRVMELLAPFSRLKLVSVCRNVTNCIKSTRCSLSLIYPQSCLITYLFSGDLPMPLRFEVLSYMEFSFLSCIMRGRLRNE